MKQYMLFFIAILLSFNMVTSQNDSIKQAIEQRNKQIARNFYEDLWFNNRTDNYIKYMADEYVAHDIGDRKGILEPAIQQKEIADRFCSRTIRC